MRYPPEVKWLAAGENKKRLKWHVIEGQNDFVYSFENNELQNSCGCGLTVGELCYSEGRQPSGKAPSAAGGHPAQTLGGPEADASG
jgi:hypothetical protein